MSDSDIECLDIISFRDVVRDVRLLMDLYFNYFSDQVSSGNLLEAPKAYTVVRAIELSFFERHNLKAVIGYYGFGNFDGRYISCRVYNHYWLSWKDKFIIDVLPMDGIFGISVPQAVFPKERHLRFSPLKDIYPVGYTMEMRRHSDEVVEELSQVFDELFKNVPR